MLSYVVRSPVPSTRPPYPSTIAMVVRLLRILEVPGLNFDHVTALIESVVFLQAGTGIVPLIGPRLHVQTSFIIHT